MVLGRCVLNEYKSFAICNCYWIPGHGRFGLWSWFFGSKPVRSYGDANQDAQAAPYCDARPGADDCNPDVCPNRAPPPAADGYATPGQYGDIRCRTNRAPHASRAGPDRNTRARRTHGDTCSGGTDANSRAGGATPPGCCL